MELQLRIGLLEKLGNYILSDGPAWQEAKARACRENNWFTPAFTEAATRQMAQAYLNRSILEQLAQHYAFPALPEKRKTVGVVMAGNIPMVGFHDLVAVFLSGHAQRIKLSSKDAILIRHLAETLIGWAPELATHIEFAELLKGCDAYIATGSNQSAVYFEQYFGKYPHLIRRNRTGVAILTGNETLEELEAMADDVHLYFGLGCRNVTKIYVPKEYDFLPLLESFKKYNWLADQHKYKHNYDYQLAVLIINKKYYMTNDSVILYEAPGLFAPISQLHYEFYTDAAAVAAELSANPDVQCIVGKGHIPFGKAQQPAFTDYADGADTLQFLREI